MPDDEREHERKSDPHSVPPALLAAARLANHSALAGCLLSILCALVVLDKMRPIMNPDLGWQLALGREVAESRGVPSIEPFTHTGAGGEIVAHQWLGQLIQHGTSERFGILGVRWLHALLAGAVLIALFAWLRKARVPPALSLLAVVAYTAVAQGRFQMRVHMLYLLVFVGLYGYVFVARPRLTPRQLFGIFAATVLWANLHSAVLIFPALVGIYVFVELAQQRLGWRTPGPEDLGGGEPRRLIALALWVTAGAFMTPQGFGLIPYLVESARINSVLSIEWAPITSLWEQREHLRHSLEAFWLLAGATWLVAFACVGRISWASLAVVLFLSILPLRGQRFLSVYFGPILFVAAVGARWLRDRPRAQAVGALVALGCVLLGATQVVPLPRSAEALGRRLSAAGNFRGEVFPTAAVRLLDRIEVDSPLYNPARWGGYIELKLGRRVPTFADGRWIAMGERVTRDAALIEGRWPGTVESLDRHSVDLLLVPRGWMTAEFEQRDQWLTLFENFNCGLYLRRSPRTSADLERFQRYYASANVPFDPVVGFDEERVARINPTWAGRFEVRRTHLDQFRLPALEVARSGGRPRAGW